MSDYAELVGRLEKQSVCIHIAAEPECAKDVSDGLRKAADAIKALVQERDQQSAGVLVLAAQLAQAKERAERAELEAAFRKKTCAVEIQRAEKAESALAECMAHATDLANDLEMMNAEPFPSVRAFHQWRAKQ